MAFAGDKTMSTDYRHRHGHQGLCALSPCLNDLVVWSGVRAAAARDHVFDAVADAFLRSPRRQTGISPRL